MVNCSIPIGGFLPITKLMIKSSTAAANCQEKRIRPRYELRRSEVTKVSSIGNHAAIYMVWDMENKQSIINRKSTAKFPMKGAITIQPNIISEKTVHARIAFW